MTQRVADRRSVLKSSVAAAASLASTPYLLPRLHAAPRPISDELGVACIGVGGRGAGIGGQAARLGKLVAVCDVHRGNAERFQAAQKERGNGGTVYTDYREMLEKEPGIDVVTIGTPDHWHVSIAIAAMAAGKHVYCEKPLTLTIAEGELIKKAVEKYGKTFQVGTQQRSEFGSVFLKAVAIAQSGRLGDKLEAVSSIGKAASRSDDKNKPFGPFDTKPVPNELDWDLWQGPALDVEFCPNRIGWNFRWWFEYSGGQVTDWGVHHTDIAFWALAGKDGLATAAQGSGEFMAVPREDVRDFLIGKKQPSELEQAYNVAHSFDVDVELSTGNQIKIVSGKNELIISGERGKIRVNRGGLTGKPVEEIDADPQALADIEERMATLYGGELPPADLPHMTNFFDCVRSGKQPVANVADHVRAVNACHLANIALILDRRVEFDPTSMQFPGDDEANLLLTRKSREAFVASVN